MQQIFLWTFRRKLPFLNEPASLAVLHSSVQIVPPKHYKTTVNYFDITAQVDSWCKGSFHLTIGAYQNDKHISRYSIQSRLRVPKQVLNPLYRYHQSFFRYVYRSNLKGDGSMQL